MDTTEFEITMENGRIINVVAQKISDDTWKVIVETETFLDERKSFVSFDEGVFCLVEASKLSLEDTFMQFEPTTKNEKNLKEAIEKAIKSGVEDFYHSPKAEILCRDGGTECKTSKTKTNEMSYEWWEKEAKNFCPRRGSRLGIPKEYFAFLGAILKDLVSEGISVKKAWHAVCEDPKELQFFWEQITAKVEDSKGKMFWSPQDFSKQVRILAAEDANDGFWMVGINHSARKDFNPLTTITYISSKVGEYVNTVGWIILTK